MQYHANAENLEQLWNKIEMVVTLCIVFEMYTMVLNIYWASKETYHFFRATLTKIHTIKIDNLWTQLSFNTPY